jgi:hypothetical protein
LVLPRRQPDQPPGNDNPPTLDISRTKDVRLSWRLEVKPGAVPGLSYYRLELVDADHTVIWESRNLPVGKGQSLGKSKRLKVVEFKDRVADEGDEGMYFFRVRAYSEAGEVLNQEDPRPIRASCATATTPTANASMRAKTSGCGTAAARGRMWSRRATWPWPHLRKPAC